MNILIGCEFSGVVRDAFCARGHNAWSCDLLQGDGKHIQKDVLEVVAYRSWDMFIVHPPCTYLCSSGLHWNKRRAGRQEKTEQALDFVRELMAVDIPKICIENPVGCIGTKIKKASQYIQPYNFGHDASKKTGLWLKGLPPLQDTGFVPGRLVEGKNRWDNQTDSGQNRLTPSADRWKKRAETYKGIALAMAQQWG